MDDLKSSVNTLTAQYNATIQALEDAFELEKGHVGRVDKLRRQYSRRYEQLHQEYRGKRQALTAAYKEAHPAWTKARRLWEYVFFAGILAAMVCCGASLPTDDSPAASAFVQQDIREWNADNIPIPYLQDSTQYVSNPDSVLSPLAVSRMNAALQRLEHELGVQSVFIVVNHIENDDPFRMAQDVGNKYGVGYNDRGLVVVVGYLDHSINMSPGRSLEADLTDAECHRLEQQYVVPAMRAEMPDSGMIYLAEAVYATLQKKQLPEMSNLFSQSDEADDDIAAALGLTSLFFLGWCIFFLRLNRKYHWVATLGTIALLPNPFHVAETLSFGGGGFGGGGFSGGGGGGFSGGSFGGGSFGGGGATSRW
jgi:uncharacterized membrane protein YgcG